MNQLNPMNRNSLLCIFLLFTHALLAHEKEPSSSADAQNDFANIAYSDVGIDHSMLTLSVGYGRYLDLASIDRRLLLFTDYALPLASLDIRDFRLRSGLRVHAVAKGSFQLPIWISLNVSNAHNKIFRATGLGSELGIGPGYYGRLFTVASELNWDQTWTSYIKHTATYRDLFYENAKDGWYSMTATSLRVGLHAAWHINKRFTLGLKGGYQKFGEFNKLIPPIYGVVNAQFSF